MTTRRLSRKRLGINAELDSASVAHLGLWFDKFLFVQPREDGDENADNTKNKEERSKHIKTVAVASRELTLEISGGVTTAYGLFFKRWMEELRRHGARGHFAYTNGRMIVGLGAESVLETSIALHRTYGAPFIPGSALKGLAAAYARRNLAGWEMNGAAYRELFGTEDAAGGVTFFDALYKPGSKRQPLNLDVITVHHPDYYASGNVAPADWDDPNPVPFLSAVGAYLVAIAGDEAWVNVAFEILKLALEDAGIGAKTSSGYGRLSLDLNRQVLISAADEQAERLLDSIKDMPRAKIPNEIGQRINAWRTAALDAKAKRKVAEAILKKAGEVWNAKQLRERNWYAELTAEGEN